MSKEIERVKSMKNKELEDFEALVLARKHIDVLLVKRKTLLDGEKPWCGKVEYCTDIDCKDCNDFQGKDGKKAQREDIHRKTMIDEHSREDELMVQIIGLQGKIERLKKEKQEQIGEFLEFLNFKSGTLEGFDSLVVFTKKDFEEELEKWEEK